MVKIESSVMISSHENDFINSCEKSNKGRQVIDVFLYLSHACLLQDYPEWQFLLMRLEFVRFRNNVLCICKKLTFKACLIHSNKILPFGSLSFY